MNHTPIAYQLAELLRAESAATLLAGSDDTKDTATRLYFAALSPRDRVDEIVEAISERVDAATLLDAVGDDLALGALIASDLYLHVESQLREPVAEALAELRRDAPRSAATDAAIDQIKDKRSAAA